MRIVAALALLTALHMVDRISLGLEARAAGALPTFTEAEAR